MLLDEPAPGLTLQVAMAHDYSRLERNADQWLFEYQTFNHKHCFMLMLNNPPVFGTTEPRLERRNITTITTG